MKKFGSVVVKSGDTISKYCMEIYGIINPGQTKRHWMEFSRKKPGGRLERITNPHLIKVGETIVHTPFQPKKQSSTLNFDEEVLVGRYWGAIRIMISGTISGFTLRGATVQLLSGDIYAQFLHEHGGDWKHSGPTWKWENKYSVMFGLDVSVLKYGVTPFQSKWSTSAEYSLSTGSSGKDADPFYYDLTNDRNTNSAEFSITSGGDLATANIFVKYFFVHSSSMLVRNNGAANSMHLKKSMELHTGGTGSIPSLTHVMAVPFELGRLTRCQAPQKF